MAPKRKSAVAPAAAPSGRATRSRVRAGSATLEEEPRSPPKRTGRKRSTSRSVSESAPMSVGDENEHHDRNDQQDQIIQALAAEARLTHSPSKSVRASRGRDIRRHFTIEVPTEERIRREAEEAVIAAEAARAKQAEIDAQNATRSMEQNEVTTSDEVAGEQHMTSHQQSEMQTPARVTGFIPENVPSTRGLSFIYSTVKKAFSPSPASRRFHLLRASEAQSRVPSPIREESPSTNRSAANQNMAQTVDELEDQDLSQIVRKRKAHSSSEEQSLKKTKLDSTPKSFQQETPKKAATPQQNGNHVQRTPTAKGASPGSFRVPSDSEEEHDEMHVDPQESYEVKSVSEHEVRRGRESHTKSPEAVSRHRRPSFSTPQPSHATGSSASRLSRTEPRNLARSSRKPMSQLPSSTKNTRTTTVPLKEAGPEAISASPDTEAVTTPRHRRRSVKLARAQRSASRERKDKGQRSAESSRKSLVSAKVIRPHIWELVNYNQYDTQEAVDAAIDAMLEIEAAEDQELPIPHTKVTPAVRSIPRVKPEHLAAPSTPTRSQRSSVRAAPSATRERNADKRDSVLKAQREKEAERKRLQQKAKELEEEQRKITEALKAQDEENAKDEQAGKKRKRVNVDELKTIPSRLPGQSSGTFSLLDDFFSYDDDDDGDYVEMDESQIELIEARPSKMPRTGVNVFDSVSASQDDFETPETPAQQPQQQHVQALERQRSVAQKYKPAVSSRLREMQPVSNPGTPLPSSTPAQFQTKTLAPAGQILSGAASSASPTPEPDMPATPDSGLLSPPAGELKFPPAQRIFDDDVYQWLAENPEAPEYERERLEEFRCGLQDFVKGGGTTEFPLAEGVAA